MNNKLIKGFQKMTAEKDVLTNYNVLVGQLDVNSRKTEQRLIDLEKERPMGTATLVAGTVVVNDPRVRMNTIIMLTPQFPGGSPGFLRVQSRVDGTSFTIQSSSVTDTSIIGWEFIN